MSLTRIPSSLVANTFSANTVLFANTLGYLSNSSSLQYFSGNNTISVGSVVAGGIDVVNYTQASYNQANTATGLAQAAFNSANNVAPQVQPAFDKANSAYNLAQASFNSSNAVNQYSASAYSQANTNTNTITLVNQYAASAYSQANTATGLAQAAFNSANNVAPQVQPAFDKANSAYNLAQSSYDSSNAVNQYAASAFASANTNANTIIAVNQYAQSAHYHANLNDATIIEVNNFARWVASVANVAAANTITIQGVDIKQNADILYATAIAGFGWDTGNTAISIASDAQQRLNVHAGINNTQNTNISAADAKAQAAFNTANDVNGLTISSFNAANTAAANTVYLQTINNNQNTSISIIQGVDNTQNTQIAGIQGVDNTQNTNITSVNQFAQSGYDKANNALPLTGGTISGSLAVTNNLTVSGNLTILGNSTSITTSSLEVNDPMIVLGIGNYTTDLVDIGIIGHYNDGANAHTGVIRDPNRKEFIFFKGYTPELGANNLINIAHPSFAYANVYADVFKGNLIATSAIIGGLDFQALNNTQNTNITSVNQYAASGYALANTNATNITAVNNYATSAYNTANTNTTNITSVNQYAASGYALANTNATNITAVNQFAQGAYNAANAAGSSAYVQAAFDRANTASANTIVIQGVDTWQNNQITYVNQFTQSAYNAANAAGSSAYVQAAFDKANNALANTTGTFAGSLTTTGNVIVTSTQAATSMVTGALTVSGGVGISGNLYAGNIYTNGALINNAAALTVYKYVATAGQTTFSGLDSNGATLAYTATGIFVTLNGVVLNNSLEYTATNGTSVVLGTAAELDDELNIYVFGAFQIADAYTSAQADSKFLTQANAATTYVTTANGTAINQFAAGAYNTANTNATNITAVNQFVQSAYNKANTAITTSGGSITGSLSVSQNLTVSGNLTVLGNSTSISVSALEVSDPMIVLGIGNYTTDAVDIGIIGHYNDGANAHTGLIRDPSLKEFIFFKGYTPELGANNLINIAHPSFTYANTYASYFKGNVISQGYDLFNYSSAAFTKANTAYTNAVNGSNTSVQFASLGVGTAASGTYGEIRAINNITAYYSSDRKYKENIINIPNALNKVESINGKMFDWTDEYIKEHGGEDGYFVQKRDFGVIAQDVQKVLPEAVRTREDGSLAVDYSKLSALAFAAIVELKKEIEELKNNK